MLINWYRRILETITIQDLNYVFTCICILLFTLVYLIMYLVVIVFYYLLFCNFESCPLWHGNCKYLGIYLNPTRGPRTQIFIRTGRSSFLKVTFMRISIEQMRQKISTIFLYLEARKSLKSMGRETRQFSSIFYRLRIVEISSDIGKGQLAYREEIVSLPIQIAC